MNRRLFALLICAITLFFVGCGGVDDETALGELSGDDITGVCEEIAEEQDEEDQCDDANNMTFGSNMTCEETLTLASSGECTATVGDYEECWETCGESPSCDAVFACLTD